MREKLIQFVIFFCVCSILVAQNKIGSIYIKDAFTNYFELPRESIFLHLNKSTYIVGEHIWFKGYIYNRQKDNLFKETSNIYVGIYDSLGNQIDKKLFLASGGISKGSFSIDSTMTSGFYYLKASTNWMKNFEEDDSYVQKIKILNNIPIKIQARENIKYDVQFLPEGGNLITDVLNTIGVKIIDQNGNGIKIKNAIVRDDNAVYVAQFKNSNFGLGKFEMIPKQGRKYMATVSFKNGKEITIPLPKPRSQGINISLKQASNKNISITLRANKKSIEIIKDKLFYLIVHKDGFASKLEVRFNKETPEVTFYLEKETLKKGINIVSLLDEYGNPVLERLFFNSHNMEFMDVTVSHVDTENDSLSIAVKVPSLNKSVKNLSISVLPKNTLAYIAQNNIRTEFYLKPYIKGYVENPAYYFTQVTAQKKYALDLLLLTQGWSKYSWDNILNSPPEQKFEFEQGLTLNATINSKIKKGDKIVMHAITNNGSQQIDISEEKNKFFITNYFPLVNEKIKISLLKKNKKLSKPSAYIVLNHNNTIDSVTNLEGSKIAGDVINDDNFISTAPNLITANNTIQLDEVTVIEQRKNTLAAKNENIPSFLKNRVTEITPKIAWSYPFITDVISSRGYEVRTGLVLTGVDGNADRVTITSRLNQSFETGRPKPIVYLNNMPLISLDVLYRLPTTQIESFFIDKTGAGEGVRGAGGVIRIYTRRAGEVASIFATDNTPASQMFEFLVKKGFENEKQFYTPKYRTYFNNAFENFGVIHWSPEVITDKNGVATIKILNTTLKDISFFIEGIGEDGSLFSSVQTIHLN